MPGQVLQVLVHAGEALAVHAHQGPGGLALAAEEAAVRQAQEVGVLDAVVLPAAPLQLVQHLVDLLGRVLGEAPAQVARVDVAHHARQLLDVEVLGLAVLHVLEAEFHIGVAAALVAEHLEPAREPLVDGLLNHRQRDERITLCIERISSTISTPLTPPETWLQSCDSSRWNIW